MPACELRPATQYDTDAVYALICELKQAEFDHQAFRVGFNANLRDPNMRYHLALLDGEVVGMIGLHLQFHLHHVNWIGEIQELVVMPQARGLNVGSKLLAWAEEEARQAGAEMTELSTNVKRHDAHRFYLREGYEQSHFRFTKALQHEPDPHAHRHRRRTGRSGMGLRVRGLRQSATLAAVSPPAMQRRREV
ncbi:aminoalkylphosphonate N-acetyltransferase [Escherichia coli]|nr:aminoalkylphosphonate N-acetyltransferase [Escherichia coli]